jgi:putative ABC transport system substrate-binding protein
MIAALGAAAPLLALEAAWAQVPSKVYRIGILTSGNANTPLTAAIRQGVLQILAGEGYTLDRNLLIEIRGADAKPERLPGLAKELLDSGVDVIVAISYLAARAAKDATTTIPIVVESAADPVETGLAASLKRPGGNLTGISDLAGELSAKRLDLLKAVVPGLRRVAILYNASDFGMVLRYRAASAVAPALGVAIEPLGVREPDDFDEAFAAIDRDKPDGLLMVTDALMALNRARVIAFAAARRLPAVYEFDFLARDGGLMSYGPDAKETVERLAGLVKRILKGAKPGDLPFEQPTQFRLVINKKTADALGVTFAQELLARADEVIE